MILQNAKQTYENLVLKAMTTFGLMPQNGDSLTSIIRTSNISIPYHQKTSSFFLTRIVTAIQKRPYLTLEEDDADRLTDLDRRNAPAGVLAAPDSPAEAATAAPRQHPPVPDVPRRSQSPTACACVHRRMLSALLTFLHAPSIALPPGSLLGPPNTARHANAHSPLARPRE
jgi:hypothetical protein